MQLLFFLLVLPVAIATKVRPLVPSEALRSRPRPNDVDSASRLHMDAVTAARRTASWHNHRPRNGAPPVSLATLVVNSALVLPTAFGADPTGKTDSTSALLQALAHLSNLSCSANLPMASGIHNLGGATLELDGGEYLISAPLAMPDLRGNWRIRGGTLRASSSFPSNRFLIEIGTDDCTPRDKQKVCSEFVGLDNVFLDGSHKAAGCVKVAKTMGTTIGPSAFCTGFTDAGVRVIQGHETILTDAWLAAYYWSDGKPSVEANVAIEINGQDNYLSNVIIFDGGQRAAVLVNGAANVLQGVHSWGGTISIKGSYDRQDRVLGCYLDHTTLHVFNPLEITVKDTFFYNGHSELHGTSMRGMIYSDNTYALEDFGGRRSIVLADAMKRENCDGVVIDDEINGDVDWRVRTTHARQSLHLTQATDFYFDFSDRLLFDWIDEVTYSVTYDGPPLVQHGAFTPSGATVTVHFEADVSATVVIDVVQCPWQVNRQASRITLLTV